MPDISYPLLRGASNETAMRQPVHYKSEVTCLLKQMEVYSKNINYDRP